MKLNTKNIFKDSSLKATPKIKTKNPKKKKMTTPYLKEEKISNKNPNTTSSLKRKLFQTSNKKINPFSLTSDKNQDLKNPKINKLSTTKKVKINIDTDVIDKNDDLFEDSFGNNLVLTSESDTNDNNNKDNKDKLTEKNQNNKNGLGIKEICQLFKKSVLKSTIIVDDDGNNNLDFEQKKIIDDYFNKKANLIKNKKGINTINGDFKRQRIRKIPTQIYKDNNLLFNKLCHIKCSTIDCIDKTVNLNSKKKSIIKNVNKKIIKSKNNIIKINNNALKIKEHYFGDKNKNNFDNNRIKSSKINAFILINDGNIKKREENEKNSIFENSSLSLDSSFLGSSLDDDFYKNFNTIKY